MTLRISLLTIAVFSFLFSVLFLFSNSILADDLPPCECTSGPCCDGCNFLSSDTLCVWTETECHWGTGCGSDVGERVVIQYCSGNSPICDGLIEYADDWSVPEGGNCQFLEVCSPETFSCKYDETCLKKLDISLLKAPNLISPANNTYIKIPVNLNWKGIQENVFYYYEVSKSSDFSSIVAAGIEQTLKTIIDYPKLKTGSDYWWRVKTCADEEGKVCGQNWSEERTFKTYPLNPPTNPGPATGTLPITLKWDADPGANFYQYKIDYIKKAEDETLKGCEEKVGTPVVYPTIVSQPRVTLYENCLGKYRWWVRSCLDKNCTEEASTRWEDSVAWFFTAITAPAPPEKGIMPCGRNSDNPFTPYNERESCQIKHLGFLLQNILDFVLWRLGLLVVGVMAVLSALFSYFSLGSPNTLGQIKSIWKSVGTGWLIMLLAWTIVNLILALAGFQAEFFGRWWNLPF